MIHDRLRSTEPARLPGYEHLSSDDPRKPLAVAALKAKSGGNRVTLVTVAPGNRERMFRGHCMSYLRTGSTSLGFFTVSAAEVATYKASIAGEKGRLPGKAELPKPAGHSYWHTGSNRLDDPRIMHFKRDPSLEGVTDFGYGPFATFAEAKRDLIRLAAEAVETYKDLHRLAAGLEEGA